LVGLSRSGGLDPITVAQHFGDENVDKTVRNISQFFCFYLRSYHVEIQAKWYKANISLRAYLHS
jgi:hypothetical protein